MTKDEFYNLALERPVSENESVYELKVYDYDNDIQGYCRQTDGKWSFEIRCCFNRLYSTLEKAEKAMRKFIKSERYTDTIIHSAETWRVPVNAPVVDSICGDLGWWLYDSKGNLIDRSVCDMYHIENEESHYGVYFGRKDSEIRFKSGDIVEVRNIGNEKPYLGIINDAPLTIDEMWKVYEKRVKHWGPQKIKNFSNDYFADVMSDCYYIVGENDFDLDISTVYVKQPSFPPPEEAILELNEKYEKWMNRQKNYLS